MAKAVASSWLETAERYLEQGDLDRAQQLCNRALSRSQNAPAALRLLALIARRAGRLDEAIGLARRAADADEFDAACACTLGELLTAAGSYALAIVELQRVVERHPAVAQAHLLLGHAYAGARSPAAAEDAYRVALNLWRDYPEAHLGLGRLLAGEGNAEGALAAYRSATEAAPHAVEPWLAVGQACLSLERNAEATSAFERAVGIAPGHAAANLGLAVALERELRYERAAEVLRRVIAGAPGNVEARKGLARVLLGAGHADEALAHAQQAAAAAPADADAHYSVGNVLLRLQRPRESLASYRRALVLSPSPKARFALASPLLMLGEFSEGWNAYEVRLGMAGVPWKIVNVNERLWDGGEIGGRRLLVHTEQGLGDTLQFIRYLPLLRSRLGPAARIELLCEPHLARLLATVEGIDAVHAPATLGAIEYDEQIPLMSLPQRFGTTPETIPPNVPYLGLPPEAKLRLERPAGAKLVVAFAWAGRPTHADDRMRSCRIEDFASLFDLPGVHFRSIQVGPRAADIEPYLIRPNVASMTAQLADLAATLAVIDQSDLVIAVDTSVVHLAGAYGKPVWTLLAYGGEWRWLMEREDSPWYPTMRLFRQRSTRDWADVFAWVRTELERMAG